MEELNLHTKLDTVGKGERGFYGHHLPVSEEALMRGIAGFWRYKWCDNCKESKRVIMCEKRRRADTLRPISNQLNIPTLEELLEAFERTVESGFQETQGLCQVWCVNSAPP